MHGYLRHLANFAHVVETGSISAAANRLGTSPSSISDSVKLLEAHFGEALLERRRSGVVPTGKGLTLLPDAQDIVAALARALGNSAQDDSGTLRVSLPSELAQDWFDVAFDQIRDQMPEITLVLMIEDSLVDHTKYARDLHIRAGRSEDRDGLTTLATGSANATLVAATSLLTGIDPNDPDAITRLPFIGRPRTGQTAEIKLSDGQTIRFATRLQVSDITTRIALMRSGLGVTTCLDRSVEGDIAAGLVAKLCPAQFGHPISIAIASPHKRPPPKARRVAEILGSALAIPPKQV